MSSPFTGVFEYEYFRLFFDASGGNDFDWLTKLQNEIINTLLLVSLAYKYRQWVELNS